MKKIQTILSLSKKRALALLLTGALALTAAACGNGGTGNTSKPTDSPSSEDAGQTTVGSESESEADATESDKPGVKLVVGATIVPHSEILEAVKPLLAEEGIELQIVEYTDYQTPNQALLSGDLDANYFQHQPFLDDFNSDFNAELVGLVKVHFEPLSLYKAAKESIADLSEGSKIGVPNDTTNEARALQLLQQEGLIKLKDGVGLEATPNDIVENELNLDIVELAAENITNVRMSLDLAVINGNYALTDGLGADMIVASEDTGSDAAEEFGNVIAIRPEDADRPEIKALVAAITSDEITQFINEKYQGSVIPLG